MLGIDLAIKLIQRLLSPSGGIILDVSRALWMLHGIQEQVSYDTFQSIDQQYQMEYERLESELVARLSVAGVGMSDAVRLMNDRERQVYYHQINQQRNHIVIQTAWDFRLLLCVQQMVLC